MHTLRNKNFVHVPHQRPYLTTHPPMSTNPDTSTSTTTRRRKVSYFYQQDVGSYYYGAHHPMKPQRLRLTHHLLLSMGLYRKMEVLRPHRASAEEMERFHSHDYVDFLKRVSPALEQELEKANKRFCVGPGSDCPTFDGLFEFMSICAGGSIDSAVRINNGDADICVNWAGGLHHAKKAEAEGFCYINDIVLCIMELLKYHTRVLYVDIDIHHGDGVEEAFYATNRVMTCSFHKYGDFFPGTGALEDVGTGAGKWCSVNVPLLNGLDDASFEYTFKPVLSKILQVFQPEAVVMCCGADSISGDRLGCWNMSLRGHGAAVEFLKSYGIPVVLLGGGGYTPRNVARCWAYETAVALGDHNEVKDEIPFNEMYTSYGTNPRLHLDIDTTMENKNTRQYLEPIINQVLENIGQLRSAPSVPFQDVPNDFYSRDELKVAEDEEEEKREAATTTATGAAYPSGTECAAGNVD